MTQAPLKPDIAHDGSRRDVSHAGTGEGSSGRRRRRSRRSGHKRGPGSRMKGVAAIALAALLLGGLVVLGARSWGPVSGAGEGAAAAPVIIVLDGPLSAPFAGEMMAALRRRPDDKSAQLTLRSAPGPSFVESVAESGGIGVTSGHKFLLARWRGVPVTAFAASFLDTSTAIFSLEKSGIRAPKDLLGKKLSDQPGSEDSVVLDALFAQLGLPRSQLRRVPVPDGFAALNRGEIDALVAPIGQRPLPSGEDSLRLSVMRPQDYGIHIPGLVYFASSTLIRDRPSVVRQALRDIILGWQEVYADPGRAARVLAEHNQLSPAELLFAIGQQRDLVRPTGMRIADFDESRWSTLRDILLYAKLGNETVGLSKAVTYDFLRDVYRRPPELSGAVGEEKTGN